MKVLNTLAEDYHIHSLNFSDWINTVDEIVQYAGKIWLKKIAITDHSQRLLDTNNIKRERGSIYKWENVHNEVEVIFGVEADLLNQEGDCCFDINGKGGDFSIMSCHPQVFQGNKENLTQAYINAIKKYSDKIDCIGHICKHGTAEYINIKAVVEVANKYKIPLEFNCGYFTRGKTNTDQLKILLESVNQIYVNSDAHTLAMLHNRKAGFEYLKEQWYIE